jgi:hypothetical protein
MQNAKRKQQINKSGLQMASNERIIQGLLNVMTPLECISAIQDSNQSNEAHNLLSHQLGNCRHCSSW